MNVLSNGRVVKVHATRIHYWDGKDEGEVALPA